MFASLGNLAGGIVIWDERVPSQQKLEQLLFEFDRFLIESFRWDVDTKRMETDFWHFDEAELGSAPGTGGNTPALWWVLLVRIPFEKKHFKIAIELDNFYWTECMKLNLQMLPIYVNFLNFNDTKNEACWYLWIPQKFHKILRLLNAYWMLLNFTALESGLGIAGRFKSTQIWFIGCWEIN